MIKATLQLIQQDSDAGIPQATAGGTFAYFADILHGAIVSHTTSYIPGNPFWRGRLSRTLDLL